MSAHQYPGQYFVLCLVVFLVWLWLVLGTANGWRQRALGPGSSIAGIVGWTVLAAVVLLVVGPYYRAVYLTLLQPG